MRCAVLCFVFLCVELARFADALKSSDKGVCVTKHTVIKTRPRTVLVALNKWCGKKKCTAKQTRMQKYSVTTNQLVCCNGFMYEAATESCAPVCSTGCFNGTCTDPDVCSCTPPTYLDPVTRNKCLTPTCDHPCINSQCTLNNTCACFEDFLPFNSTHCSPNCTEGFQLDSNLICAPKCDNCTNGRCVAPNMCNCDPGYKFSGMCVPQCDIPCDNGWCAAPNTCQCSEGYINNGTVCIPQCDGCANGICVSPNTCKCLDGYTPNGRNCVPRCDNCINGLCVAPNRCKCKEGFIANGTGCIPKCDGCVNGHCTAPGVCECEKGYSKVNGSCEPRCKERCVNGRCVGPDACACDDGFLKKNATVCLESCKDCRHNGTCMAMKSVRRVKTVQETFLGPCGKGKKCQKTRQKKKYDLEELPGEACCDGYEWVEETDTCKPLCLHSCEGGTCVSPNTCECETPLILVDNKCTLPVCNPPCANGKCTAPNKCTCNEGYFLKEENYTCAAQCTDCENGECRIPNVCECIEGYTKIENKCRPVCRNECRNGICAAPDMCSCNDGYQWKNNTCLPTCGVECVNGNCVAPNTCECLAGFEPKDVSKKVCEPKCESCANGDCIGPNQCSCHKGYALIDNVCRPTCEDTCVNGACVAPNTCECFAGFEPTVNKEVCSPKCDACVNGDCVAPNECICRKGYALKDNICVPTCEDKCVNANCVAPNTCECFDGFEPKSGHEAVCMPKCDSCAKGECVAPNKCVCHSGYVLTDDGCRPKCRDTCVNGDCTAPDTCTCKEGYTRNMTEPSICYKACIGCGMGTCSLDGECICGDDSKLVNGTCLSLTRIEASGMESTPGLASLEMSWLVGGAVGVLLVVLVLVVIQRMWRRRKDYGPKAADNGNTFGSVIYTLPDTLIRNSKDYPENDAIDEDQNESDGESTSEKLMAQPDGIV